MSVCIAWGCPRSSWTKQPVAPTSWMPFLLWWSSGGLMKANKGSMKLISDAAGKWTVTHYFTAYFCHHITMCMWLLHVCSCRAINISCSLPVNSKIKSIIHHQSFFVPTNTLPAEQKHIVQRQNGLVLSPSEYWTSTGRHKGMQYL